MLSPRYDGFLFKKFLPLACLSLVILITSACVKHPPRNTSAAELQNNTSEVNPSGFNFEVVDLNWEYYNDKAMIKVFGSVRNNSGQALQAVTLKGVAFDEKGAAILSGRSFLEPTYLPVGAEAKFEYRGLVGSGMKNIKYIRLVTQATTLN